MPFKKTFTDQLEEILLLIEDSKIDGEDGALAKFTSYLDTIQDIGPFSIENWPQDWRVGVWKLGERFKTLNPQEFLAKTDKILNDNETKNKEVIEFIRSELAFNFLPDYEWKKTLEILIGHYPLNPEFRHTLGHYYKKELQSLLAIAEYKLALKIDGKNGFYLRDRFAEETVYLNRLITQGDYNKASEYIDSIFKEAFYKRYDSLYHNTFVHFKARVSDHLAFQSKIKELEIQFKENMNKELEAERKRIIEVLGFFSAIVAFILTTVSIGKNFSFIEATYFIIGLGIILILFAVSLSILFSSTKQTLMEDKRFWILVVSLIVLLIFIVSAGTISTAMSKFTSNSN